MKASHYVYIYYDPRNGDPIYVGLGVGKRAFIHWNQKAHNIFFERVLTKIRNLGMSPRIEFVALDLFKHEAALLESQLIELHGRRDIGSGTLLNLTNGGEGAKGYVWTEEQKSLASTRMSMNWKSKTSEELAVVCKNISNAAKISMNRPEVKQKAVARLSTPEAKSNAVKKLKEKLLTVESKEKKQRITAERWKNPEYAARISDSVKRSWAKRKEVQSLLT